MQTLTNSYHNTSVRIRTDLTWDQIEDMVYHVRREFTRYRTPQDRRVLALHRRIKSALCGMSDCKCGTVR
jgi:hypothetical protein